MQRMQRKSLMDAGLNDISICSGCGTEASADPDFYFFICPCGRKQCRNCPRIYDEDHVGVPCSELDQIEPQNLEVRLSDAVFRVGSHCNTPFVQWDACNKVECPCGTKHCYICMEVVTDYSHFCRCGWKGITGQCPNCHKSCPLYGGVEQKDNMVMEQIKSEFNTKE